MVKSGISINDKVIFIILLCIMIMPLVWLSFYNHPSTDDFTETTIVWSKGFLGAQGYWYNNWTGRYFALFMVSCNPLVFGATWAYKLNVILLIGLIFLATYTLVNLIPGNSKQIKTILIATFLFTHFLLMPDIAQGLFWQSNSYSSYFAIILSMLLFACVIKFYRSNAKVYLAIACILCAAIIGSYEIFMAITDLLALLLFAYFLSKKSFNKPAFILLLVCIFFSVIEIMAPGNNVRESLLPNRHHFIFSLISSVKYSGYYILKWAPVMVPVLIISGDFILKEAGAELDGIFHINPIYPFLFCICVPGVGLFPGFWALGEIPPLRAFNIVFFYFLVSSFYCLLCLVYFIKKRPAFSIPPIIKVSAYAVLLCYIVFKSNNLTNACSDLFTGAAQKFDEQMAARNNFLVGSKEDTCSVEAIKYIPKTIFFEEPPKDTSSIGYKAFCSFYKKKHITIK